MRPIVTDDARVCVSVLYCWVYGSAKQKRVNRPTARLQGWLHMPFVNSFLIWCDLVSPRNHVLDGGQDRKNPFAAERGLKSAMRPFAKLLKHSHTRGWLWNNHYLCCSINNWLQNPMYKVLPQCTVTKPVSNQTKSPVLLLYQQNFQTSYEMSCKSNMKQCESNAAITCTPFSVEYFIRRCDRSDDTDNHLVAPSVNSRRR